MRKMMGTGGVKKMYGGGSVLARGVRFGKNKPTKLFKWLLIKNNPITDEVTVEEKKL
jgi:hypothetical protein